MMKQTLRNIAAAVVLLFTGILGSSAQDQHLDFMGIPIQGDIVDFTNSMRPRYQLQKKVGGDHYYIYKGTVCGHEMYLKAEFSRKTRTVYKITVTPKFIDQNAFLDSLTIRLGEPEETTKGYRWIKPEGEVFLYTPEGYDPVLIFFDRQGAQAFKEEQ